MQPDLLAGPPKRTFRSTDEWVDWVNDALPKPTKRPGAPVVMDLLAGCGGLAVGFEQAQTILREAGVSLRELQPRGRERAALCLLGVARIRPDDG